MGHTHRARTTAIVAALLAAAPSCTPSPSHTEPPSRSGIRVELPSPYVPGYAKDLAGEVLQYDSPIPSVGTSLLVRSQDRRRSISWESAPVPADHQGDEATFALMVAIDVNEAPRTFDLAVTGEDVLRLGNPTEASEGEVIRWSGASDVEAEFRVTLIDRHGDAMGFLYVTVPRRLWTPGEAVRFDVSGESAGVQTWFMVFREPMRSWVDLANAPAVLKSDAGEVQIVQVDLVDIEGGRRFRINSPIGQVDTTVALGHLRLELPVPSVSEASAVDVGITVGDHSESVEFVVAPPRRMEIDLIHHTHVDIGYTNTQDEVEAIQWASLEKALELGEASKDFPDGARFIWHPESIWAVDSYVRAHPGERTERLLEGIRNGWIELDAGYTNSLTGLFNEEGLMRSFDAGRRLAGMSGVPIETEMVSDIPGFSWGLVHALSENGVRYLSIGPNQGHRIGRFTEALGDRPFYWEGPVGNERVLVWVSGAGYSMFHTGLNYERIENRLEEDKIFAYVERLAAADYPYDAVYLRYNIGSDNGPPDPTLAESVRAWNERYASPTIRIASMTEFFRTFEERHGRELPTYRGDLTGYWEDGAASSARETALVRRAAESLTQTTRLARVLGREPDAVMLEDAWRNVLLFIEHTWGSWNSISEPEAELTVVSWERKKSFADKADALARRLRADVLGDRPRSGDAFEVLNTLDWPRSDLVVLPAASSRAGDRVEDEHGGPVPSQRLSTGELAFVAADVPATGSRRYRVMPGAASQPEAGDPPYDVAFDPETGAFTSLVHRATGRELVATGERFDGYVYVAGRDPADAVTSGPGTFRWTDKGPLVWTLEATLDAPGTRAPLVSRIRIVAGLDRVEVANVVAKAWVLEPEAVLFRFPFAVDDPTVRIDVPFGSFRPGVDQVPGSNVNYFSAQRWVDVSGADGGVTLTTIDAPLLQVGAIHTDAIITGWLDTFEPSATLWSYVMNNYWETNYRAAQDDEVTFRYALRAHGAFEEAAAERFALERAQPLVVR